MAALVAGALRELDPALELAALPLVGIGRALADAGVEVLGPVASLPSAGLTLHHPRLLLADVRAGLVGLTVRQVAALRRERPAHVVVVGDVYAHLHAMAVAAPRSVVQTLVSVHMDDGGAGRFGPRRYMEGFRWPETALLRAPAVRGVYVRDAATAEHLRARGVIAHALGNAMMDGAVGGRPLVAGDERPRVALLPGTRGYAVASVGRMLAALAAFGPVQALVAWTHDALPPPPPGWRPVAGDQGHGAVVWRAGGSEVRWYRGRFRDVLASAEVALGTSGTAHEQAAGLGIPVVAFPQPPIGWPFLRAQRRLLGDALLLSPPEPAAIAATLRAALAPDRRARARRDGPSRLGAPGAARRIAAAILRDAGEA